MRLRVWEWGDEAAPAVLCVHGASDHGRMWDGFAPHLADLGYRVLAPDVRGHGDSGRLSSGHICAATVLDLALLARAAGPPVGLVGHSLGGGVALMAAGVWPELVRWVVDLDGLGPRAAVFEEGDLADASKRGLAAAERVASASPRVYASRAEMVERRASVNTRLPRPWVEHLVRTAAGRWKVASCGRPTPSSAWGCPHRSGPATSKPSSCAARCSCSRAASTTRGATCPRPRSRRASRTWPWCATRSSRAPGTTCTSSGPRRSWPPSAPSWRTSDREPVPAVLVLHDAGDPGAGSAWAQALEGAGWPGPVHAPDLPGHGTTSAPADGACELVDAAFAVLPVLAHLGSAPPVVLGVGAKRLGGTAAGPRWAGLGPGPGGRPRRPLAVAPGGDRR